MDATTEKQDEAPVVLQSRQSSNPIVSITKKLAFKTFSWVGVYMLGFFDFSIAWMITPLLLSVLRDQWKKDKRNKLTAAREAALSNEQAMIEARMNVDDLPSWVFFPDKERAEWVNSILKQLWPYVNNYVRDTLFNTVEPAVDSALKAYKLTPFKFDRERVFLGHIPPRITGIKVYDTNISRKEIILDLDIVFASDLEIVFKVKGIPARVSDFGLRGMARVVFKPLISQIPLIGGVQVYFLKAPDIDYTLGGVAGTLEIPGLSKIVERIIIEQVKNFLVLPNKFSMPLASSIPNKVLKCPDSAGVLRVKLMRASDLMNKDGFASGKSDPYIIMTVGAHTHRVPTINDSLNPRWDLTYDFPIEVVQGQELMLEFYDEDDRQDDEFLGRAKIQTSVVAERGYIEGYWVDLVDTESGKVQVTLSWLPVIDDSSTVKNAAKHAKPNDDSAKGLVHIYIDSCSGLFNPRDPTYKPSPMLRLITNHEKSQQSWPKYFTNDPIIEQGFVMLIRAPYTDEIKIDVINTASKNDEVIGTCSIRIWALIEQPGMEYPLQPWLLRGNSPDAKIVMSASLRGLLPPQCSPRKGQRPSSPGRETAESFTAPTSGLSDLTYDDKVVPGRIRLIIHKAEELEKKDVGGKSDPYVVIKYEKQRSETQVCKKTIAPVWDHEVCLDIMENGDNQITLELFDKDNIGKDERMGRTTIDVRRISKQKKLSNVWETLIGCSSGKILLSADFLSDKKFSKTEEKVVASDPSFTPVKTQHKEETLLKKDNGDPKPTTLLYKVPAVDQTPFSIYSPDSGYQNSVSAKEMNTPDDDDVSIQALDTLKQPVGNGGKIRLNILYDERKEELKVFVHEAANLPGSDLPDPPDPCVKLYLMPGKKKKKKTAVVKDNGSPMFNEEFDFSIEHEDVPNYYLKLTVVDKKGVFAKSPVLGTVDINLNNPGLSHGLTDWYPLEDMGEDSD